MSKFSFSSLSLSLFFYVKQSVSLSRGANANLKSWRGIGTYRFIVSIRARSRRFIGCFQQRRGSRLSQIPTGRFRAPLASDGRHRQEEKWRQYESRVHRSTREPISPRQLASANATRGRLFASRFSPTLISLPLLLLSLSLSLCSSSCPPGSADERLVHLLVMVWILSDRATERPTDRPTDRTTNQPFGIRSEILKVHRSSLHPVVIAVNPPREPSFAVRKSPSGAKRRRLDVGWTSTLDLRQRPLSRRLRSQRGSRRNLN